MLGGGRHLSPDLVNIEWSYEKHGTTILCEQETNEKIEMAYSKDEPTVHVCLQGEVFVVDLMTKTGRGQHTGEHIILNRKWLGTTADQPAGFLFPENWTPMPHPNTTVHTVQLSTDSSEYRDVVNKFQATVSAVNVQKIERIQNPHLYQNYMLKKQKMDQDNGGVENERQLFHGTRRENISHINLQGFNRSFSRYAAAFGSGVYFAKDSSYSVRYAGHPGGNRYMYLARVLVGQYCTGYLDMVVPPPKDPSRPEVLYDSVVNQCEDPDIFVVFLDNQCYPEYLITFQ